jgi:hypothetical protein
MCNEIALGYLFRRLSKLDTVNVKLNEFLASLWDFITEKQYSTKRLWNFVQGL